MKEILNAKFLTLKFPNLTHFKHAMPPSSGQKKLSTNVRHQHLFSPWKLGDFQSNNLALVKFRETLFTNLQSRYKEIEAMERERVLVSKTGTRLSVKNQLQTNHKLNAKG